MKNKLLLRVSMIVVFFVFITVLLFGFGFTKKQENDSANYSYNLLENVDANLKSYFDEVAALVNEVNYDYTLQKYLIDTQNDEVEFANLFNNVQMQDYEISSKIFGNIMNSRTDISSIMIFNEKEAVLYRSSYLYWPMIQDYSAFNWYKEAVQKNKGYVITGPDKHNFILNNTEKTFSLSKRISSFQDGAPIGVMLIDLNLNKISEICTRSSVFNDGNMILMSEDGQVLYKQNAENLGYRIESEYVQKSLKNDIVFKNDKWGKWTYEGETYQITKKKIGQCNWTVLSIVPMRQVYHTLYQSILLMILFSIGLLVVIIAVLNYQLKKIVRPIVKLADTMDDANGENLTTQVDIEGEDETGRLARSYNKMLERISSLMQQVRKEQEEKRKYEQKMLQAQINPHFLYNTLDSIIWMAELKDPHVVPMTEALARLFRISLNKGREYISIHDELEHVKSYLAIQSMRYEDKFEYQIQASDDVQKLMTIKLLIQPIVENSIYHGIKTQKKKGNILISVECIDSYIVIQVKDNGHGMDEIARREILVKESRFENSTGSGIGVKNVNERIKLYFGEEYGLRYESVLGEGTTVTIKIPKLTPEEIQNE